MQTAFAFKQKRNCKFTISVFTKPGEVDEILSLYQLKEKGEISKFLLTNNKFIFRYQDLVEIYSVSAETIINDAFSYENV